MLQVLRDMNIEVADVGEKNLEGEKEETILKPSRDGQETVKGWVRVGVSDADNMMLASRLSRTRNRSLLTIVRVWRCSRMSIVHNSLALVVFD